MIMRWPFYPLSSINFHEWVLNDQMLGLAFHALIIFLAKTLPVVRCATIVTLSRINSIPFWLHVNLLKGCDIFKIIDLTFVWKANKIRDSSKWSQHLNRAHNPLHAVVIILTLYRINLNFKLSVFDFVDHWISIFPLLRSMDCWICVKPSIWKHSFVTTQMIKKY